MKLHDRLIGLLAVLAGLAIIAGTFGFRDVPGQQFGSGFFPRIVAGAIMIAGVLQILTAQKSPWVSISAELKSRDALLKLVSLGAVVLWLLSVETFGFVLTTMVLAALQIMALGGRPVPAVGVAIAFTFGLHYVFGVLLRVPLPRGVVEGWLL